MENKERYARQLILPEVGDEGQEKIARARVVVIGAGGLGSPVLLYLAAAGVGTIGIVDDDVVSESNLQRQILYDNRCTGKKKALIAADRLKALNPGCEIQTCCERLNEKNAFHQIKDYDIVVDATDNLASRYLIDDASLRCGIPFVYGSICEFRGQVSVFNYRGGPSYRDLYPWHAEAAGFTQPLGVIGALPGVIGSLQASETLKIILGRQDILSGKLLLVDLLNNSFRTLRIQSSTSSGH